MSFGGSFTSAGMFLVEVCALVVIGRAGDAREEVGSATHTAPDRSKDSCLTGSVLCSLAFSALRVIEGISLESLIIPSSLPVSSSFLAFFSRSVEPVSEVAAFAFFLDFFLPVVVSPLGLECATPSLVTASLVVDDSVKSSSDPALG